MTRNPVLGRLRGEGCCDSKVSSSYTGTSRPVWDMQQDPVCFVGWELWPRPEVWCQDGGAKRKCQCVTCRAEDAMPALHVNNQGVKKSQGA